MFLFYCMITGTLNLILAIFCKSSILALPGVAFWAVTIIELFWLESYRSVISKLIPTVLLLVILCYGIIGHLSLSVAIVDYIIVMAQAICGLIAFICFVVIGTPSDKAKEQT